MCYDVIKASWFPRRSALNSEKIKNSMRDLWEVLNTIQKRWRADSKAVAEAEEAKKIGELPGRSEVGEFLGPRVRVEEGSQMPLMGKKARV